MSVIFRRAKAKDVEEIVKLCNECFEEETSLEYAKRMFKKNKKYEKMNTYSILNHVCVKPDYRRHNIATKC